MMILNLASDLLEQFRFISGMKNVIGIIKKYYGHVYNYQEGVINFGPKTNYAEHHYVIFYDCNKGLEFIRLHNREIDETINIDSMKNLEEKLKELKMMEVLDK